MSDGDGTGRYVVVGGMVVTALAVVASLLFVGFGGGTSSTSGLIGGLNERLLVVAVPIAVLVEAVLVYAAWRFHDNEDRKPTPENREVELAWTVATGLVILFVGVSSYHVLAQPAVTAAAGPAAPNALDVQVTGHQWYWSVAYPEENVSVRHADRFYLPVDRPIRITVTSGDVIHSFHAPRLGLKQDAIPGQRHTLATRITRTGQYRLYCAEYCGEGHARMKSTIVVANDSTFEDWLAAQRNETS